MIKELIGLCNIKGGFSTFSFSNSPLLISTQNANQRIELLQGIKTLRVDIGHLAPILKESFSQQLIEHDIESKLEKAEIEVETKPELYIPKGPIEEITPLLSLNIDALKTDDLISFVVEIRLWEWIRWERNPKAASPVIIWQETTLGTVGREKLFLINDLIKNRIDKFISDFLLANSS